MTKTTTTYTCAHCGYTTPSWMGKCPECDAWNSFGKKEEDNSPHKEKRIKSKLTKIKDIDHTLQEKTKTAIAEFDRVIGSGITDGMSILFGGEPGIGKSTLVLQIAGKYSEIGKKVLYVSGEESPEQISERSARLNINKDNIWMLSESLIPQIEKAINTTEPNLIIIDSIQTLVIPEIMSSAGSVLQVREIAFRLNTLAKNKKIPIIFVGHVTKEGMVAGPKVLEHIVDTVIYLEGDGSNPWRILRPYKNRFGPTSEIGLFQMTEKGFEEVKNPGMMFLKKKDKELPGAVITCAIEGGRPLLLEIQSLVSKSPYSMAKRTVNGVDTNRVSIIAAVLEKKANVKLFDKDIFIKIIGGIRINDTALDLAIASAIISSTNNEPFAHNAIIIGEIGLTGEIHPVSHLDIRLKEIEKLGFKKAIIPNQEISLKTSLDLIKIKTVRELV
ncbi:DNA repair protein RadA [Candidatus Margulisiibacteriota bacterium]